MKVKVVKAALHTYWYADKIGQVFEVAPCGENNFQYKLVSEELWGSYFDSNDVELINEEEVMKKNDLKTGMRVVTQDGWSGIYLCLENRTIIVSENDYLDVDGIDDKLLCQGVDSCNIVEIYAQPKTLSKMLDPSVRGDLVWKRQEKSEEQIQLEKITAQIDELKSQADKLQSLMKNK